MDVLALGVSQNSQNRSTLGTVKPGFWNMMAILDLPAYPILRQAHLFWGIKSLLLRAQGLVMVAIRSDMTKCLTKCFGRLVFTELVHFQSIHPSRFLLRSEQVPLQVLKELRGGRHQQRDLSRCYTASIIQCSLRQCPTNLPQTFPTISNLKQKQQPNLRDSTLQTWASLASDQQQAEEKCSRASMQIEISGW